MSKKIVLIFNTNKSEAVETAEKLLTSSALGEAEFLLPESEALLLGAKGTDNFDGALFALVLGGDGTFLRAARMFFGRKIPLYGINLGRLGFLSTGLPENIEADIKKILDGKYRLLEREVIKGSVVRQGKTAATMYALNDLVISKTSLSRVVELQVSVNGELLSNYLSDGVIFATPTGSTAYALSAGGPVVPPNVSCLIMAPICAHTLFARPVVLNGKDKIAVELMSRTAKLCLTQDGQLGYELFAGDRLEAELAAEFKVCTIEPDGTSYYDLLRRKLSWGFNGTDERMIPND